MWVLELLNPRILQADAIASVAAVRKVVGMNPTTDREVSPIFSSRRIMYGEIGLLIDIEVGSWAPRPGLNSHSSLWIS